MAIEIAGFEMAPAPTEVPYVKENGQFDKGTTLGETVTLGSHEEKPSLGEGNKVSEVNFPTDAIDEWPAPKRIHTFYMVKYRSYEDPSIKVKIEQADKEIQRRNLAKFQITETLREKRSERADLIAQLKALGVENRNFNIILDEKRKDMEPLHEALGKLRHANTGGRGSGLCSSEEELNLLIQSLNYRIQHESIPLTEEKQLLREIKQLEGTREKVIANAAMKAEVQKSVGEKEAIQDRVKLIGAGLDEVRKDQQVVKAKIKVLKEELEAIDAEIKSFQDELSNVIQKKDIAYETIQELRRKRDEGNACFYRNRTLLNQAKELAARRDVRAIEEIAHSEVENFFALWNGPRSFREDYENRIASSLDFRQMSRDGRTKSPDEKPVAVVRDSVSLETESLVKASAKKAAKEDPKTMVQHNTAPAQKVQKETVKNVQKETVTKVQKETVTKVKDIETTPEHHELAEKENADSQKPPKRTPPVVNEVDLVKLKEMKREEEIAKAKQAMERKKKLAEKNAAKAAIKAQKEAEKKLKEREKKAKKKAGTSAPATDSDEAAQVPEESVEMEKVDPGVEAVLPVKEKFTKENPVRHRTRTKGAESLPKAILKRKKSSNYWVYVAPVAVAVTVALLLVLGYYYTY
ncbi:proton pump-interactor 1-like [Rhodamnia argentea]|uniref:Proton pump-interactor 1-like n=1 Tax=Rhodamnia argentea TaxID=178133 RepID=A0A8B8QRS7_9MYRT|nr:proton pump-interactor 1-like [Rhodamnia argentea]XP_030549720.1 proton pump-interactor 1-like [Rhodamnia argentea]XP_048130614.1 proton pump-interactor 1-like [Rhodamnia argentea]